MENTPHELIKAAENFMLLFVDGEPSALTLEVDYVDLTEAYDALSKAVAMSKATMKEDR